MQLLSHFLLEESEFLILKLKTEEIDVFSDKLPKSFRDCYISKEQLEQSMKVLKKKYGEIMQSYIPEKGNIKSGEFGEILSYYLLKERYSPKEMHGPKKWLWKDDKNQ